MSNSGSNNGKLAYTFPGIQDLVTMTYDQMRSIDNIIFGLDVDNGQGATLSCSNAAKCQVRYKWEYTPVWDYISPQVVYPGQVVMLKVNPKRAMGYKSSDRMALDFRLDGVSVDLTNFYGVDSILRNN